MIQCRGKNMIKKITISVVVCLCLLLAGGNVMARDEGFYAGVSGLYALESIDTDHTEEKFSGPMAIDFDSSWGVQVRGGLVFNKLISVEAVAENIVPFTADLDAGEVKIHVTHFSINGKLSVPSFDTFVPYVIAGVGYLHSFEDISYAGETSKTRDWGMSARGGFGIDYFLKEPLALNFESAYTSGFGDVDHVKYTTVSLGMTFYF